MTQIEIVAFQDGPQGRSGSILVGEVPIGNTSLYRVAQKREIDDWLIEVFVDAVRETGRHTGERRLSILDFGHKFKYVDVNAVDRFRATGPARARKNWRA